jgi:hypothetical protein
LISLRLSQTFKKVAKNCRAILREYPSGNWQPVIQTRVVTKLIQRFDGAAFGIKTTENQPLHARLHYSTHAHDAGFERHVQVASG